MRVHVGVCVCVGSCVSCRDDFNIEVLHAFLELHEFTDLNLVQALRQFLWSFRLPGEAQKIDRMMEAFAQRYCRCNPGVFQSTGTYVCVQKRDNKKQDTTPVFFLLKDTTSKNAEFISGVIC